MENFIFCAVWAGKTWKFHVIKEYIDMADIAWNLIEPKRPAEYLDTYHFCPRLLLIWAYIWNISKNNFVVQICQEKFL